MATYPSPAPAHFGAYLAPLDFLYAAVWNALEMPVTQVEGGVRGRQKGRQADRQTDRQEAGATPLCCPLTCRLVASVCSGGPCCLVCACYLPCCLVCGPVAWSVPGEPGQRVSVVGGTQKRLVCA